MFLIMRLLALLSTAVLGASSVAFAQPAPHWEPRYGHGPQNRYAMLAEHVHLEGRGNVRVDLGGTRLHTIELDAIRGGADIRRIGVQYSDGSHAIVQVQQPLDVRRAPSVRFDLGPQGMRGVSAIVVYGDGDAAFRVLGG